MNQNSQTLYEALIQTLKIFGCRPTIWLSSAAPPYIPFTQAMWNIAV